MEVAIQSPDIIIPDELHSAVSAKITCFKKLCEDIQSCDIILKKIDVDNACSYNIVIKLLLPHKPIFASKRGNSFEDALDMATEAVRHQLLRIKSSWRQQISNQ